MGNQKMIVDDTWVLGAFVHRETYRIEMYRERISAEIKLGEEEGVGEEDVKSARMRIRFCDGVQLEGFLEWYRMVYGRSEVQVEET
jgi:hypothetical protein